MSIQPAAGMYGDWGATRGTGSVFTRIDISQATLDIGADVGDDRLERWVIFHELMHFAGLDHSSCDPKSSLVSGWVIPAIPEWIRQNIASHTVLTPADQRGLGAGPGRDGDGNPPGCREVGCTPLILDLGLPGVRLTEPEVLFDILATGQPQRVSWPSTHSGDAWLVMDRNSDGKITDGRELFGDASPLGWGVEGPRAENGFHALGWFDGWEAGGNGDGRIDENDMVWPWLRAWRDWNENGTTDAGELKTLPETGVVSISLHTTTRLSMDTFGNIFGLRSRMLLRVDHAILPRFVYDVWLVTR